MNNATNTQQSKLSDHYKGAAAALLSAFLFGFIPILAVSAYKKGITVMTFHFMRFIIASIALFCLLYFQKGHQVVMVGKKNFLQLFVLGGILFTLTSFSYFSSFQYIPASMAALIFYSYPALVAIGSLYVNKEPLTTKIILSITLSTVGLIFLSGKIDASVSMKGVLLAGFAALSYTSYILYGNSLMKKTPYQVVVAFVCFFSAVSFFIVGKATHNLILPHTTSTWLLFCIISLVSLSGFLAFFLGVKLTTPSIAAILSMAEPLVTVVLSLLIFKEYLTILQYLGGILVLAGSFLALKACALR